MFENYALFLCVVYTYVQTAWGSVNHNKQKGLLLLVFDLPIGENTAKACLFLFSFRDVAKHY